MKLALCSRANSPEQPTYARIYRTPIKRALGEVWLNVARFTAFLLPPFFPPSSFFPLSLPLFSLVFSSFSSVDRSRALPLPLSIARHRYRGSGSILLAMGPITGEGRGERLLETNRWKFFSVFLLYYTGGSWSNLCLITRWRFCVSIWGEFELNVVFIFLWIWSVEG